MPKRADLVTRWTTWEKRVRCSPRAKGITPLFGDEDLSGASFPDMWRMKIRSMSMSEKVEEDGGSAGATAVPGPAKRFPFPGESGQVPSIGFDLHDSLLLECAA